MITNIKNTASKLLGIALILFFVALGIVGIILPVIPGLLFLMIAALIAARHFPALAYLLEQNRYCARCLRISSSFMDMNILDKARLCFWGTVKVSVDGLAWSIMLLKKSTYSVFAQFRKSSL